MTRGVRLLVATSGVIVLAVGCERATEPQVDLPTLGIRTDSASYYLNRSQGIWIDVYIDNLSAETVSVAQCGGEVPMARVLPDADPASWTGEYYCHSDILEGLRIPPGGTLKTSIRSLTVGRFRLAAPLYLSGRSTVKDWSCCYSRLSSSIVEVR
jgi:hypothetical protein